MIDLLLGVINGLFAIAAWTIGRKLADWHYNKRLARNGFLAAELSGYIPDQTGIQLTKLEYDRRTGFSVWLEKRFSQQASMVGECSKLKTRGEVHAFIRGCHAATLMLISQPPEGLLDES